MDEVSSLRGSDCTFLLTQDFVLGFPISCLRH